jgi:catechol 2,3-dioxygenase-like lactoylglutathione lyase family enzyme
MTRTATSITQIGTIAIPATDQDRSLAFYVDRLGFEKTRDVPFGNGQRWIEVAPPDGGTTIAIAPQGSSPVGVDTGIRLTTDDAEADHAAMLANAVDVDTEILRFPGVPPMFNATRPGREHPLHRPAHVTESEAGSDSRAGAGPMPPPLVD